MGDNSAYTIMEATVIGAYDLGKLDKALLGVLLEPYRHTDIDSGGCCDLESKDGLGIEEVIVKVGGGKIPPRPDLPEDYRKWTDEQCMAADDWRDKLSDAFRKVTKKYGW